MSGENQSVVVYGAQPPDDVKKTKAKLPVPFTDAIKPRFEAQKSANKEQT